MPLTAPSTLPAVANGQAAPFRPYAVESFEDAGLSQAAVEGLVLKFLLQIGTASGRRIAEELGLPFGIFPNFFRNLKNNQIVAYANVAAAGDYDYFLTDSGRAGPERIWRSAATSARPPCRSRRT